MLNTYSWQIPLTVLSTILPGLWSYFPLLEQYTLQACATATILYIVIRKAFRSTSHQSFLTLFYLNLIVQTLVVSTGRSSSPLFFLYYFVLFAFAIYFDHLQIFVISITTIFSLIYLNKVPVNFDKNLINLLSLLLITPLASIYSKAIIKLEQSKEKIEYLENDIANSKTDSLLWLSTENRPLLNKSIDAITDLIIYLKSTRSLIKLPNGFLEKLKNIQSDLLTLYSSSDTLEDTLKNKPDSPKV